MNNNNETLENNQLDTTQNDFQADTTISQVPMIPVKKDIEKEIHDDAYFEEEVKKTNLVFEEKHISPFKLYFHLSGPYEILLMILGTICALGAGVAAPLMCYLFGDMANDFSEANVDENQVDLLKQLLNCKNKEQAEALAGGNFDRAWSYFISYI